MKTVVVASFGLLVLSASLRAQAPGTAAPPPARQAPQVAGSSAAPRKTMAAYRIGDEERLTLDGRLDEAVWAAAVPATDFIQQDPDNGKPATEQTEVRILYNSRALYMGVTCLDSEPEKWIGYQRRRDEFLQSDDRFMWNFDTFNNQQSGYFFEMNPSGLMGDALRSSTFQNRQWDGIWYAKVRRSEIGWTLEVEIPFSTLNFDPNADAWGVNFQRTVRRKNEESLWTGWLRNQGLNRLSNSGLVTGLHDMRSGHGVDLKPYAIASAQSAPGRKAPDVERDAAVGLDVYYSPSPRVRTNVTINTDFAQTEVDQRLTNLERFPQFFPEKREFFLDGSTFFDFQSTPGQGDNSLVPYFSRKIGLNGGVPQKIDIGGKLAGQFGKNDIGALFVRTGEEKSATPGAAPIFGDDFMVLRAKHRMLRQSYVGALYTGRHTRNAGTPTLNTAGADFFFATSTFMGTEQLSLGGFFVNTTNPSNTGKNNAFGLVLDYPNDPWNLTFLYREIQDNYNAGVGFTPRTGFRRLNPSASYTKRPRQHPWMRSVQFGVGGNFQLDTSGNSLLNRDVDLTVFNIATHRQDTFQVHVLPFYEYLERNFAIPAGPTLPARTDYSWLRYRFQVNTAARRVVSVNPTYEVGGFYNGTRTRLATDVNVRLRPGVIIYTSAEWNWVDLDQGKFTTRLYRIVPELQFSPWMAWVNNVQYDTQSSQVGWQSRFRWILKPGNDLYVVYTRNWLDDPLQNRTYTLDQRFATKALYTHRF